MIGPVPLSGAVTEPRGQAAVAQATWERLRTVLASERLPPRPPALRTSRDGLDPAEALLEQLLAAEDAGTWARTLRSAGIPVEPVVECDRPGFISRILHDPVIRELGRVLTSEWEPLGRLEQVGLPLRFGPPGTPPVRHGIPGLGEHTDELRSAVGYRAGLPTP